MRILLLLTLLINFTFSEDSLLKPPKELVGRWEVLGLLQNGKVVPTENPGFLQINEDMTYENKMDVYPLETGKYTLIKDKSGRLLIELLDKNGKNTVGGGVVISGDSLKWTIEGDTFAYKKVDKK